ncbi:MAG: DUF4412 domain-containing protein [Candidatus Aminicenantales bacterium]
MKKFFFVAVSILFLSCLAAADIHIKAKSHSDAFTVMGQTQPEKNEIVDQWVGDNRFASHSPDQSTVIDLNKNLLYLINHQDKTYVEASLPLDLGKLMPPEMAQMMGMMKVAVTVNPLGQTKTVGSWNCRGYEVSISMMMMPLKMIVWASTDVPFNVDQFNEKFMNNILKLQMRIDDQSLAELRKIKGYWIAYEQTGEVMGAKMHTTYEVTSITKENPPASIYTVPTGYTKSDKLKLR